MTQPNFIAESVSPTPTDVGRCVRLIRAAERSGFTEVKFHQARAETLFANDGQGVRPLRYADGIAELPEASHSELSSLAADCGMYYSVTPHYLRAIAVAEPWVDTFAVSSYQLLWLPLLRELGATQKPLRVSVGMAEMDEVVQAVEVLRDAGATQIELLHSVNCYPTPPEAANLRAISTLRERLGLPVGWADHTGHEGIVTRALRIWGASSVELVFDYDGSSAQAASSYAWTPPAIARLRRGLGQEAALASGSVGDGNGIKMAHPLERSERDWRCDPLDGLRPLRGLRPEASALSELALGV